MCNGWVCTVLFCVTAGDTGEKGDKGEDGVGIKGSPGEPGPQGKTLVLFFPPLQLFYD